MKKLTMWLMIAVLSVSPIGCGSGPGTSGENPKGEGAPVGTSESEVPAGEQAKSTTDILDEMGPGGEADPDAPAAAPADKKK